MEVSDSFCSCLTNVHLMKLARQGIDPIGKICRNRFKIFLIGKFLLETNSYCTRSGIFCWKTIDIAPDRE